MISVVVTSRADGYGRDNLARALAHYASWRVPPEVVLVDWNGLPGAELVGGTRRLVVTLAQHRQFPNWESLPMFYHLGQNLGIRGTHGEWVLSTSQDVLVEEVAEGDLAAGCFYRQMRWDQEEDGTLAPDGPHGLQGEPLFTNAAGDFILMQRSAWETIRGYPEWPVHSIYLDGLVCYQAHLSGLREVILPGHCIHQWHRRGDLSGVPHLDYVGDYAPLCEYMLKRGQPIRPNNELWGTATPKVAADLRATKLALGVPLWE